MQSHSSLSLKRAVESFTPRKEQEEQEEDG